MAEPRHRIGEHRAGRDSQRGWGSSDERPQRITRLQLIDEGFRSLPERYVGGRSDLDATYHIKLCDLGHTWEVRCTRHGARVRKGVTRRKPDVTLTTGSETWLRLRRGQLSGIEALQERLLGVRGNLDLAVAFEGMFRPPGGRPPALQIHDVPVGRHRISTLTMGSGPDVLLLHGLGGSRASFFETAAELSNDYRVHAPDLPGFGSSCKPALGSYNARWFAEIMLGLLDELEIGRAHLVGNSMGGRVAIEVGLQAPHRVGALGLLSPAVAWVKRALHPIVRLLRPELGLLPHGFSRSAVASQLWSIFYNPDVIDPAVGDLMVDEFRRIYHTPGARYALLASARNIYLEAPFGRGGFYPRLARLRPPALFIWGSHDRLVPPAFGHHVSRWLPGAEQLTIECCGHVPQVECPEQTNRLLREFFARADQSAAAARAAAKTPPALRPDVRAA